MAPNVHELLLSTKSMDRRDFLRALGVFGLGIPAVSALLAACGGDDDDDAGSDEGGEATPTGAAAGGETETSSEEPEEEAETEVEDAATEAEASDIPTGGTVRHLIYEDPDSLNFILGGTSIGRQVYATLIEGLVGVNPDGEYYPILATEVPTVENGGVSEDGLTVTWHLKPNVLWSDGEPFTADDVIFTYEAATIPESVIAEPFSKIESIEAVDDLTVTITYSEIDVGYIEAWRAHSGVGIIPRHATGDVSDMANWEWNRSPVGTGPFVFEEWVAGDHVSVVRNENYHVEGRPILDRIDFLVIPAEESRAQMMLQGDGDIMLWPGANYTPDFEASGNVAVNVVPGVWNARMYLNMSAKFDDDPGPEPPHFLFGDLRVRQAISMAIDRDRISNDVLEGDQTIVTSPFPFGWYACEQEPYEFNPERAKELLEEAGWVEGDDGVREAQGAQYAEDGTKAEVGLSTYSAFLPMELTALAIQEDLANIGISVEISIEDFAVIFGSWEDGAPRKTGDFDIVMYDTSIGGVEPHQTIFNTWHSSSIPSAENPGGANYSRFNNPEADALLEEAGRTLDQEARRDLYCQMAEIEREVLPIIYLYQFNEGNAYSTRIQGYVVSTWEWSTWDAQEWYLQEA